MATRNKKKEQAVCQDDSSTCGQCRAGVFEPGDTQGVCHLYPMEWVLLDEELQATHRPAVIDGFCLQFIRKVH